MADVQCKSALKLVRVTRRGFYEYNISSLGVVTKLDSISPDISVTWTPGSGNNGNGNDYVVTPVTPPQNMGGWVVVEGDVGNGAGSGNNALIVQHVTVVGGDLFFTLYSGDDGGGTDEARRRDVRFFMSYTYESIADIISSTINIT